MSSEKLRDKIMMKIMKRNKFLRLLELSKLEKESKETYRRIQWEQNFEEIYKIVEKKYKNFDHSDIRLITKEKNQVIRIKEKGIEKNISNGVFAEAFVDHIKIYCKTWKGPALSLEVFCWV
jgi:hypothetical protein